MNGHDVSLLLTFQKPLHFILAFLKQNPKCLQTRCATAHPAGFLSAIKSFLPVVSRCYMMGEPVILRGGEVIQWQRVHHLESQVPFKNKILDYCQVLTDCIHIIRSLTAHPSPQTWLYVFSAADALIFSSNIWKSGSNYGHSREDM